MSELRSTYRIIEKIGSGGGSVVYKAYHNRLQQVVVLKCIRNSFVGEGISRQEVDLLKNLSHTHLLHVLDYLETPEGVFTVMNYVEGSNFKQLLAGGARYEAADIIKWTKQLLSALDYLHSQRPQIIHGDIKPSNIILQPDGNICLIDFNVAFLLDAGEVLGYSPGYSSPEQFRAASAKVSRAADPAGAPINTKSDIYSAGATMYHIATGQSPAAGHGIDIDRLSEITGRPFAHIIAKATKPDPQDRYASAREMMDAIEKLPLQSDAYRELIGRQKRRFTALLAAAILCIGAGVGGYFLMQHEKAEAYDQLVAEQRQCIEDGKFREEEALAAEATSLIPSRTDAYYWHAASLYQQGKYADCNRYIALEVLNDDVQKKDRTDVEFKDTLIIGGLSDIELEKYKDAIGIFEKAESIAELSGDDLRSFAAALAYDGQYEKAKARLNEAEMKGTDKAGLDYTRGEIKFAQGEYDEAIQKFEQATRNAKNDHMKMRAYLMLDKIYTDQRRKDKCKEVLEQAARDLPAQKQYPILERLAQADIDLKEYSDAAACLNEIISRNWDSWQDHDTLASVYYMKGDLEAMKEPLRSMEKLDFEKKYRIDMWRALAAIKAERYSQAEQFYDAADVAYQAYEKGNEADHEMMILREEYRQLKEGGWL